MIKKSFKQNFTKRSGQMLAFSLAEVLVVTGMIGMVADLLMPELVGNYRAQSAIVQLKRSYAVASNAYQRAVAENGTPDAWGLSDSGAPVGLESLNNVMSNGMKVLKNCGTGPGCFPENGYKNMQGSTSDVNIDQNTDYTKMILADGTSVSLSQLDSNCDLSWGDTKALSNVCGTIGIDINGLKGPNTYGDDYFGFVITKHGIIPMGTQAQSAYSFDGFCNKAKMDGKNGLSCSAWALYNDNMDYKDCIGLSWNGSTTCAAPPKDNGRICTGQNDNNNDNNGKDNKNFKNGNNNDGNNGNNNCNGNY